jgi:putative redox protein
MYAERKGLALQRVEVQLSHKRIHAKDCEDCETKEGMLDEIRSEIHLEGDLDEAQRKRFLEIATLCPVHRTLSSEISLATKQSFGKPERLLRFARNDL